MGVIIPYIGMIIPDTRMIIPALLGMTIPDDYTRDVL